MLYALAVFGEPRQYHYHRKQYGRYNNQQRQGRIRDCRKERDISHANLRNGAFHVVQVFYQNKGRKAANTQQ